MILSKSARTLHARAVPPEAFHSNGFEKLRCNMQITQVGLDKSANGLPERIRRIASTLAQQATSAGVYITHTHNHRQRLLVLKLHDGGNTAGDYHSLLHQQQMLNLRAVGEGAAPPTCKGLQRIHFLQGCTAHKTSIGLSIPTP